ncbi:MAG: hypothetical protein AAFQ89_14980 [Cyanobacteria bacterium J06626_18]
MFHLYLGAFDIVLYLGGAYFAMVMANAICDDQKQAKVIRPATTRTAETLTSAQATISRAAVPASKREEDVPVQVSIRG